VDVEPNHTTARNTGPLEIILSSLYGIIDHSVDAAQSGVLTLPVLQSSVEDPWHFGADPYPDPTPDPTSFFIDFKDAKEIFFSYFFLITCTRAHHLQSKNFNFWLKFCVKILFCSHYFSSPLNPLFEKREGSGARSGSVFLTNGSGFGSGRPKKLRIPNTACKA
jgi:hypothetical protein